MSKAKSGIGSGGRIGNAQARSGGGITGNKNVRVGVRPGQRTTNAVSPAAVSRIGTKVVETAHVKMFTARQAAAPLGNELAKNVGGGGPGAGRTVHATGSQSKHGGDR